jgi:TPR repeat protein
MEGDEVRVNGVTGVLVKKLKTRATVMTDSGAVFVCKPSELVLVCEHDEANRKYHLGASHLLASPASFLRAAPLFRAAAELGHPMAQYNLGCMYDNGDGVRKNAREAVRYYELAAAQSHCDAEYNLALKYIDGDGVAKDEARAAQLYERAALSGIRNAQYNAGVMYEMGMGVEIDIPRAIKYFKMCAAQGDENAAFKLSKLEPASVKAPI